MKYAASLYLILATENELRERMNISLCNMEMMLSQMLNEGWIYERVINTFVIKRQLKC